MPSCVCFRAARLSGGNFAYLDASSKNYRACGIRDSAYDLCTTEAVTFRQLSADAATYRDAVEFKNGVKIRLQGLEEGQGVKVLALSSEKADSRDEKLIAVPV